MTIDPKHARQTEQCHRCRRTPILAKRRDRGGWRALYWCPHCEGPAYAGDSFAHVHEQHLDGLPAVVSNDKQGSLF